MKSVENFFWKIFRVFFPEQRKWACRALITAGISMLSGPLWVPYVNAFLSRYVRIDIPDASTTGWVCLVLGLLCLIANEALDRWPFKQKMTAEDKEDKNTLYELFSQMHLPTYDWFFHHGKSSMVYIPALHYHYGVEGYIQATQFHLHDQKIRESVELFYQSCSRAFSYGFYFAETSNPNLQKFSNQHNVHTDPNAKAAHDDFLNAVYEAEGHLKDLYKAVKTKYPDFDMEAMSKAARDEQRALSETTGF
ncbi:TPA: hypothetical protein I3806_003492 [Enterobacter cloacae]|nr:hypothetical protein [Enterobacter cloacae]